MSKIDGPFVKKLALVWHGIDMAVADAEVLARMLGAMDDAAERETARLSFEAEPALYQRAVRSHAGEG